MLLIINLKHDVQISVCIRTTWEHVEKKDSKVPRSQILIHKSEIKTRDLRFEKPPR